MEKIVPLVILLVCLCSAAPNGSNRTEEARLLDNIKNNRYAIAVMPGETVKGYSITKNGEVYPIRESRQDEEQKRLKRSFWEWLDNAFVTVANFFVDILGLDIIPRTLCGCFNFEYFQDAAFILLGPLMPTYRVFDKIIDGGFTLMGYDELPEEQQEEIKLLCNCSISYSYPE